MQQIHSRQSTAQLSAADAATAAQVAATAKFVQDTDMTTLVAELQEARKAAAEAELELASEKARMEVQIDELQAQLAVARTQLYGTAGGWGSMEHRRVSAALHPSALGSPVIPGHESPSVVQSSAQHSTEYDGMQRVGSLAYVRARRTGSGAARKTDEAHHDGDTDLGKMPTIAMLSPAGGRRSTAQISAHAVQASNEEG